MFYCQVATVLTVYGIETLAQCLNQIALITLMVATVLTVYGIETDPLIVGSQNRYSVATVLTVYGIETAVRTAGDMRARIRLQQYLPFTVLKPATLSPICS